MSHEHLGLFDTPPSRRESVFALALVGVLFAAYLAVLPVANIRLGETPAFVPTICAAMFVGELIVAALLYAQAVVFKSRALTVLASGYVLTGLLLIPYALSFPGAFAPAGLLPFSLSTTAWLMFFRWFAVPLVVILYALLKQVEFDAGPGAQQEPPQVLVGAGLAAALAVALTILATVGHDLLPPIFLNRSDTVRPNILASNIATIVEVCVAIGLLLRRRSSVLDTWLVVSQATLLILVLLNLPLHARFTLGWYCEFLLMLFSHLIVLLALIAESNRLYVRLALATAAQGRERDARMMSVDGVAAAISHEIGQPLTAVSLSASAALNSLTRAKPDSEKAIRSLRDTVDAAQRAFAVTKSIRVMFGERSNALGQFDLNELVRDTAALLDREMAAHRISLRLALDEPLPPVLANRVQIQRVIVNLLMNAIESLAATEGRPRRIAIHSATGDHETVQVEISDSGPGIAAEAMTHIFEPYFTTKSSGTGLGLALSRTIVESHGGRLWATRAEEDEGATFHLELHCASATSRDSGRRAGATTH